MSKTQHGITIALSIAFALLAGVLLCSCNMVSIAAQGNRAMLQAPILAPGASSEASTPESSGAVVAPETSSSVTVPEAGSSVAVPEAGSSSASPETGDPTAAPKNAATSAATSAPAPSAPAQAEIAMSLVFDISGSMDDPSGLSGVSKLDSAKRQSTDFVSSVRRQGSDGFSVNVGVVSFSTEGWEDWPLSSNPDEINAAINALTAWGRTNMYAGLEKGIEQLKGTSGEKLLVFLSDGLNNEGRPTEDILTLAQEAADEGIKIYTIGFGPANELDEALLTTIADITGGVYSHEDSSDLNAAAVGLFGTMMQAQLEAQGEVLISTTGSVEQGATTKAGEFTVEQSGVVTAYLYWPGSVLDLFLTDPDGVKVEEGYAGYSIDTSTIPTTITIENAKKGLWTMDVFGRDVSMAKEPFYVAASIMAAQMASVSGGSTNNAGGLLLVLGAIVIASIVGVYAFTMRKTEEQRDKELYG